MLFSSLPNTRSAYWPAHTRLSQRCVSIQLCCVSSYKTTDEVFQEQFFLWERGVHVILKSILKLIILTNLQSKTPKTLYLQILSTK